MKRVKLTDRLKAVADLIDDGASVADIGTDHGHLPAYLALKKSVRRIIAADISADSLNAARRTAADHDVTKSITFLATPGLDQISPDEIDTVVIAGLGGETILNILKDAAWTCKHDKKLILQPQSKAYLLFRFLYDTGYDIKTIRYVKDRGKRYIVILAGGQNERK